MNNEKSYGVNQQTKLNSLIDAHIEELQINGFSILNEVLTEQELIDCRVKLDNIYEIQKENFGEENLKKINENNLVRCPKFLGYNSNTPSTDIEWRNNKLNRLLVD